MQIVPPLPHGRIAGGPRSVLCLRIGVFVCPLDGMLIVVFSYKIIRKSIQRGQRASRGLMGSLDF